MRRLAIVATLAAVAGPAAAQQVLYTPVPPKGSAYLRFVNALDGPAALSPDFLPAQTLGADTDDRVSAYAVVEHVAGRSMAFDVTEGARSGHGTVTADPGSFVTVLLRPAGATSITGTPVVDQTDFNQTRARLSFYNATTTCPAASLVLMPAKANVFANVAPGAALSRSVNPVTASVVPTCADGTAPPITLQGLQAGGTYSLWIMQPAAQKLSFMSHDSTLPWKP